MKRTLRKQRRRCSLSTAPEVHFQRLKRCLLSHPPVRIRYLDQSQPSATDGGGSCSGFLTGTTSRGNISPLTPTPTTPRPATPHPATPHRKGSTSSAASLHEPHTAAPVTSVRKEIPEGATAATAPPAAGATVAPRSPPGAGTGASRAAAASTAAQGKKRPRVPPENPYRRQSPEQQQPQQGRQHEHHHHYRHQRQQQDDAAASEWEGAEILVVGERGDAVPGRGSLDWCGMCGAHVLRADAEVSLFVLRVLRCRRRCFLKLRSCFFVFLFVAPFLVWVSGSYMGTTPTSRCAGSFGPLNCFRRARGSPGETFDGLLCNVA